MKIPKILYHVTKKKNLLSIMKRGLLEASDYILFGFDDEEDRPGVNLVRNLDDYPFPPSSKDIVLKIKTSRLSKRKFVDFGSGWMRFYGNIPASNIIEVFEE